MAGILYLVATPIGNLGDFTPRAVETLENADFIAAEDTRVSMKLLNHFGVKKPLISYHEHNHVTAGQSVLNRLLAGESCALMTDAGTPAISDPGEDLVRLCAENGVEVRAIPGCCAAVNALAVSGLPTGRFTFEGFLTVNKKSRREHLNSLKSETRTMIFHEAPHKLRTTLNDLTEAFGPDRRISLCRELTKLHEEVLRFTLAEAVSYYEENAPKGEYVLVVAGAAPKTGAVVTGGRRGASPCSEGTGNAAERRRQGGGGAHRPFQKRAVRCRLGAVRAKNPGTVKPRRDCFIL